MKALFIIFHGLAAHNGISKKIIYQREALARCGMDVELCYTIIRPNGDQCRMIDDKVLENYGNGIRAKINKRISYGTLAQYIIDNDIKFVYLRSAHNANPFINRLLRRIKKHGVRTVLEIPTYPYEGQFKASSRKDKLRLWLDMMCRHKMARHLHRIVTFTSDDEIFGVKTISISNGIDFNHIKVKQTLNDTSHELNLIGVAELHYWHAYDRVIRGLANYYTVPRELNIKFNVVGEGVWSELNKLKTMTTELGLEHRVIFHGVQSGDRLDELFFISDMGVASLGRHRSNITNIKTLKNREYAARGIPFIYSEIDDDFEQMPYIMKAPANEDAINIEELVAFYRNVELTPQQIRATILDTLSWDVQMKKVIDQTFK